MVKLGTVTFTGASGSTYEFNSYAFGTIFKENYGAVYFITNRDQNDDGSYSHERIYVGETEDLSTRFDDHHKQDCFDQNNANCICIHGEQNEKIRLNIERDLIDNYNPPCNG